MKGAVPYLDIINNKIQSINKAKFIISYHETLRSSHSCNVSRIPPVVDKGSNRHRITNFSVSCFAFFLVFPNRYTIVHRYHRGWGDNCFNASLWIVFLSQLPSRSTVRSAATLFATTPVAVHMTCNLRL